MFNLKKSKLFYFILLFVVALFCFYGCSSNDKSSPGADSGESIASDLMLLRPEETNRKIIYTSDITFESKDITEALSKIKQNLAKYQSQNNAYINNSNVSFNNAYISVRIKTEFMEAFIDEISVIGAVQNININAEDITSRYNTSVATKEALQAEINALRIARDLSINDPDLMFKYSQRIGEIEAKINLYNREIASYDEMLEYSTVNIRIYNKGKTPLSEKYTSRIARVFIGSLESLVEFFKFIGVAIVAVFPFAVVGGIVYFIYLRIPKKPKPKKTYPPKNNNHYNHNNTNNYNNNQTSLSDSQDINKADSSENEKNDDND